MNDIILQIVSTYMSAYKENQNYNPFDVWKSNHFDIINRAKSDFSDEDIRIIKYLNNVIYWGQMEVVKYV